MRGSRIKAVIDELRGERIDIIRWSDSLETLIMNGLKPATIHLDNIYPDIDSKSAVVLVDEEQQSLAIGKRGQNVRLASRLCGWDIDIKTREEFFGTEGDEGEGGFDPEGGDQPPQDGGPGTQPGGEPSGDAGDPSDTDPSEDGPSGSDPGAPGTDGPEAVEETNITA